MSAVRCNRLCLFIIAGLFIGVILSGVAFVKRFAAYPLIDTDSSPNADAAYVLAGGYSIYERLNAASDLYHMRCVTMVCLLADTAKAAYDFTKQRNLTTTEWMREYLTCRGVPDSNIMTLGGLKSGLLGTLNEAEQVAATLPPQVQSVVLVTSAPHTRRARLAFQRRLPSRVRVSVVAATAFEDSAEFHYPLWLEYTKLLVYWLVA